jgi:lipopolysaccharide export system permease protein
VKSIGGKALSVTDGIRRIPGAKILDRYILNELAGSFFFGIMAFTIIFIAGDLLFQAANLIIEKGVSLMVVARLFVYRLPEVILLTVPMSSLLSTLLTFGRLSVNSEIVAIQAAGISFRRVLRPVLGISAVLAMLSLIGNETIVPFSNRASENLMKYEILQERPSVLKERVFLKDEQNGELKRVLYLGKLRPREGLMSDILVQEFDAGKLRRISTAVRGTWKSGEWWVEQGEVFEVADAGKVNLLFRFDRQRLLLNLSPEQLEKASRRPAEMSSIELLAHINILKAQGANLLPLWVLFHLKLSVPWSAMILAVLGASIGVRTPRRGGSGIGFGLCIIIVFAYYVVMSFSRALGETGNIPPLLAAWLPNVTFLALGAFFVRKAD